MVPPNPPLMLFEDALRLIDSRFPNELGFTREEKALELCLQNLKQSAGPISEFLDYVWQPRQSRHQDAIEAVQDAVERYENFRIAREKLAFLAKIGQFDAARRQGMRRVLQFLNIEIDEQGTIQPLEDWFTKAVDGVEATRIRECQYCERIFWAGRPEVQGCSPRCLDCLRKRNKRRRDAEHKQANTQRSAHSPLNETEKRDLIRRALRSGGLDQSEIAKQTKLTADEVADVLTYLILESGEIHSELKDETRFYCLKKTQD
jgi:hypothetical protein